jgi:hypothetical protein
VVSIRANALTRQKLITKIGPRLVTMRDRVLAQLEGAMKGQTVG